MRDSIIICIADRLYKQPMDVRKISWEQLQKALKTTKTTSETLEEFKKLNRKEQLRIKDVGGFVGAELKDGMRNNESVITRTLITLDLDNCGPDIYEKLESGLGDYEYIVYSTHKHSKEEPRLRLVMPLKEPVTPDLYIPVARKIAEKVGIDLFDDTTFEPARTMFFPSTPSDQEFVYISHTGKDVDADEILKEYTNPLDLAEWPMSERQKLKGLKPIGFKSEKGSLPDPRMKPGAIGLFCRTYSIHEAIETFLGDVYEPDGTGDTARYTYLPSASPSGVVVKDNLYAYSHHATDPACGGWHNAFDLVRLHKFAGLDKETSIEAPMADRPSFKAMLEFVKEDFKCASLKSEEFSANNFISEDATEEQPWRSQLEKDNSGDAVDATLKNISLIFRNDKELQNIQYNAFTSTIEKIGKLPWDWSKGQKEWCDADDAFLHQYFEDNYGISLFSRVDEAFIGVCKYNKYVHPVKDRLDKLKWDGVERLDTLLVDFLNAEDTPYVRAVTRKTLVAAVARVYEPGIKFDTMLVLCGPQGLGKSTIFAKLADPWFSDNLTMDDMKDKTGAEKLQGRWIVEVPELSGMRKAEVETIKAFITRQEDQYRPAYGRYVEKKARQCIIVGTTNAMDGFLRDTTGNRRFWPVNVQVSKEKSPWKLTREYIDQVWAEAKIRYESKEPLYITEETVVAEAAAAQREAMESDERFGLVEDFLERKLADNWYSLSIAEHKDFLYRQQAVCTIPREYVCNLEIYREALNGNLDRLDRKESYTIRNIMAKMPGWEFCGAAKKRFGVYGNQQYYRKVNVTPSDTDPTKKPILDEADLKDLKKAAAGPTPPPLTSFDEDYRNGLFETVVNAEIPEDDTFNEIGDDLTI